MVKETQDFSACQQNAESREHPDTVRDFINHADGAQGNSRQHAVGRDERSDTVRDFATCSNGVPSSSPADTVRDFVTRWREATD